jgi:hypothetical protein
MKIIQSFKSCLQIVSIGILAWIHSCYKNTMGKIVNYVFSFVFFCDQIIPQTFY